MKTSIVLIACALTTIALGLPIAAARPQAKSAPSARGPDKPTEAIARDGCVTSECHVNIKNYAMFISRLTPTWFHNLFRKYLWGGEYDNVPTFYRANTQRALHLGLNRAGFERKRLFLRGGAYLYLQFSRVSYFLGLVLNRISDFGFLKKCKLFIFALYQKR